MADGPKRFNSCQIDQAMSTLAFRETALAQGQANFQTLVRVQMQHAPTPYALPSHIFKQCNKIDWKLASSPWAGLFYGEPGRMLSDNTRKRQSVGSKLLRYMLGMPWPSADPDLLKEYREMVYPLNPDSDEAKQLKLPPIIK